jgi:hypothetical protein
MAKIKKIAKEKNHIKLISIIFYICEQINKHNMRKIFVLFLMLIFCTISYSQETNYVPFPTANANWMSLIKNILTTNYWKLDLVYKIGENDTIIDNVTYHTLYTNTPPYSYHSSFRESDKKIYVRFPDKTDDLLLYDFNLNVGDTMFYFFEDNFLHTYEHHKKVLATGTIQLSNGETRRTMTLTSIPYPYVEDEIWVEGIGSITRNGLFNPMVTVTLSNGEIFKFAFHCVNEQVLFQDTDCPYCECNYALSLNENLINSLDIFPNPFTDQFSIASDDHFILSVEIYNAIGMQIKSEPIDNYSGMIHLENCPSGLYYLRINFENGSITRKILKQ